MGYAIAVWQRSPVKVYAKGFAGSTNYPNVPPGTYTWCDFVKLAGLNDPICNGTGGTPPSGGGPITGDPPESEPPAPPCGSPMSPGPAAMQTVRGYTADEHLRQPAVAKLEPMPIYTDSTKASPKYVVEPDVRLNDDGQIAVAHAGTGDGSLVVSPAHVQRWNLYGDGGPAGTNELLKWPARLGQTTLLLFNGAAEDGLSERDAVTRLGFGLCAATTSKPASGWYVEHNTTSGDLAIQATDSEGADDGTAGRVTVNGEAIDGGLLGTVTSTFTQTNNTSEQTAASATMAANRASVGMLIRVRASGYVTNTSGGDVEFVLRVRFGGLAGQILGGAATFTLSTGAANKAWTLDQQATVRTIGATGTIQGGAAVVFANDTKVTSVANTAVTVDTTASNAIVVTVQKDTADATAYLTLEEASIEILGVM